jgi:hypothetical protein
MKTRSTESLSLAVVLLIAPLTLLWLGRGATFADLGGAFSPMFFPTLILWFWAGMAAVGLLAEFLRPDPGRAPITAGRWARVAAVAACMAAFVWGFREIGFALSGIGFCLAVLLILDLRTPLLVGAFSVLVPAGFLVLFHHLLGLPLPTSPFSFRF